MWTLGQRCRLPGLRKPYFIASKEPETQTIFVVIFFSSVTRKCPYIVLTNLELLLSIQASGTEHPALYSESFRTGHPHWIHSVPEELVRDNSFDCRFRFQHTKSLIGAKLESSPSGLKVTLSSPVRSLTPGQYAVFYFEEECLGCARIV